MGKVLRGRVRQLKPTPTGASTVRRKAWLRYWRTLAWWQGPSVRRSFDPVGEISKPIVTGLSPILFFRWRKNRIFTAGQKKLWRNRKERKQWAQRLQSDDPGLEVVHPDAAGIDVGSSSRYVAVRPDCDQQAVGRFECFTADLYRLADGLQSCEVKKLRSKDDTVDRGLLGSDSTIFWKNVRVYLVNARHTKNLPGRNSNVQESQWWLKLHTCGLLSDWFQPPVKIRVLRTYWRQRGEHVAGAATCTLRMQKVLTQMNLQPANVISDISGLAGQTILRAVLAGERDPGKLV